MSCNECRKRSFIVCMSGENHPIARLLECCPSVKSRLRRQFPRPPKIARNDLCVFKRESGMAIERHDAGPRMSKAVVHGNTVYLAGIVADNPKGKSVKDQTQDILRQIDGFLAKAGTDKSKLLSANIWITDMANFAEMNAVWDAWVAPGNTPARATVEARLAAPDYKVEIMVVAAK